MSFGIWGLDWSDIRAGENELRERALAGKSIVGHSIGQVCDAGDEPDADGQHVPRHEIWGPREFE